MEFGGDGVTLINQAEPVRYTVHEKGFSMWQLHGKETCIPPPLPSTFHIPGWDMKLHALFQPGDGTLPK